jgi:uncharacterized protein (TIGR02246 family)
MRYYIAVAMLGMLFQLGLGNARAQESEKPPASDPSAREHSTDLEAIRAQGRVFVDAFNKGDAKALAALWTEDATFTDEDGHTYTGREAIEKGYARYFADNPDAKIRIVVDSLRLLSDTAAIEDGRSIIDPPPEGAPGYGKYMAVHVKLDGKWLMSTVRETRVETPSAYRNVADLEFLIGTWTAEEHGAKSVSVCRWVANKSFVERKYTVMHPDGSKTTGVQLIGWNPQDGHVQSWNFSSDGGHAVGVWSPQENGWSAEVEGVTGEGASTTAVVTLTRLDENAYAWQSVQRTLDGNPVPDTDEVVIKRSRAKR